jgi:hypothetical protein
MSCRASQSYLPYSRVVYYAHDLPYSILLVEMLLVTRNPSVLALSNPSPRELLLYLSRVPVVTMIHRLLFVYFLPEIEGIFVLQLLYYDITFPAIIAHCCVHVNIFYV